MYANSPQTKLQVALGFPTPSPLPAPLTQMPTETCVSILPSTSTNRALQKHSSCMASPPLLQPWLSLGAWGYRRAPRVPELVLQMLGST